MRLFVVLATFVASLMTSAVAESQGVFEIRLKNFNNDLQKDSHGRCCRGFRTKSGRCSELCSTKFRVCLTHYQSEIDPSQQCTFGEHVTGVNQRLSAYNTIQFPFEYKWPRSLSLIIEAWHENNTTEDALISRVAKQQELDAGVTWTHGVHSQGHSRIEYEYRMVCSAHYYGSDCDTLCRPRDDQFGHYECDDQGNKVCLQGWQKNSDDIEGDYCTKPVCSTGCHLEHGECQKPGECKCRPGWKGKNCDECELYPGCKHGTCSKPYTCLCKSGWGGLFCDQDLNYCTNNSPCMNGATCLNTGQGSYTCSCPPGFTGRNCQTRVENECSHQPCLNGGTCQGSGASDYKCICPIGFDGKHCEMTARDCSDNPCKNGAKCINSYRGSVGYRCQCAFGYQGFNCDVKIDHCRTTPCENGGTCIRDQDDSYKCRCPPGFSGDNCGVNADDCALNPCQNGGTCFDLVNDYKCTCAPGFGGENCEENINDCAENPCANGGTCHDLVGDFVCTCKPGYTGKDCSKEVNECDDSPCMNNGFCIKRFNDFECKCLPGYSGKSCHVLPDGTVMPLRRSSSGSDGNRVAMIATFSTVIPILVVIAAIILMCNKQAQKREQRRADAKATRENELNAVSSVNKTKMLDDHMIQNSLEFPNPKRINANPNIANEELFSSKDSTYKQMVPHGSKKLNTDATYSAKYCDKLLDCASSSAASTTSSNASSRGRFVSSNVANRSFNDCASTVSSSSSESSSRGYYNKKSNLPTAASIQNDVSTARSSTYGATAGSTFAIGMERASNYACTQDDDMFATEV